VIKEIFDKAVVHLAFIAILGFFAYSNTFEVPFHFDDKHIIAGNQIVKNLAYFTSLSGAKDFELYDSLISRYVGYLTFALNYRLHGLDTTGYHIFNLAVHIINACLVYFLVVLTFRTPKLGRTVLLKYSWHVALFSALLFVSHPLQTQAVTYIVQRFASLAATFYLFSLVTYISSRLSTRKATRTVLYILSLLSAVLAMKTKEISFTLPLVAALYESMFFKGALRVRFIRLLPLMLIMLIIPLSLLGADKPAGDIMGDVYEATRVREDISRVDYLLTQPKVIATYVRLLAFPVNQNLDYDYPLFRSFFEPPVFLSFLFMLSIFGLGVYLLKRSRTEAAGRLAAFGVFWFFIALSVESSLIPLQVIFEHRAYLPSVGVFMTVAAGAILLIRTMKNEAARRAAILLLTVLPLVLCIAAFKRNNVWKSEESLWADVVKKSPKKARGHNNLGLAYEFNGFFDKAIEQYRAAIESEPDYAESHVNLGLAYHKKGLTEKSIGHLLTALSLVPDYAEAHNNLGFIYHSEGLAEKAIRHYKIAVDLKPDYAEAYSNLGVAYALRGMTEKSMELFRKALSLKPDYAEAYNNLGIAFYNKGYLDEAIEYYNTALRLKPDYEKAHLNLGIAYYNKGLIDRAIGYYNNALRLNPDYVKAHFNLGIAYLAKGFKDKARHEFEVSLELKPDYNRARNQLDRLNE
jgi:tetratricopeptide (TPR) repeat protein